MSRSEEATTSTVAMLDAAFPPDFPLDTDYLLTALARWNRSRRSCLAFGELTSAQMRDVLTSAAWLKQEAQAGR